MINFKKCTHIAIATTLLFLLVSTVSAQTTTTKSKPNYSKQPVWIEMMDDTLTNYYEVEKAYNEFWANRVKPQMESDVIGEGAGEKYHKSVIERFFMSKKERQEEEAQKYAFVCKKYEYWKIMVQQYVQPDGRILTPTERVNAWKIEQQLPKN
jgi:hypothetical protein